MRNGTATLDTPSTSDLVAPIRLSEGEVRFYNDEGWSSIRAGTSLL